MPKSLIGWVVLIIVAVLILKNPAGAGHAVSTAVNAGVTFLGSL